MNQIGQILRRLRIDERWMLMAFLIVAVAVPTIIFLFFLRRSLLSETELARSTTTTTFLTTLGQTQEAATSYQRTSADTPGYLLGATKRPD